MNNLRYIAFSLGLWLSLPGAFAQVADSTRQKIHLQDSLLRGEFRRATYELFNLLVQSRSSYAVHADAGGAIYNLGSPVEVVRTDSGYRFVCANNMNAAIHFSYLTDLKIKIYSSSNNMQAGGTGISQLKLGGIVLAVGAERQQLLKNIRQQFINVQRLNNDLQFKIVQFEGWVAEYLAVEEKPVVTEQLRKLIIQADAAAKLYQYEKAISLNNAAIRLHPTAYPNVYLNVAVLQGETGRLHSAIYNMRKFLMFHPAKTEIDFANGKIAEWEIILNN